MTRPGGVTAIAIWYLITGVLALLSFCIILTVPAFGFLSDAFSDAGFYALATVGLCVGIFALLDAILSLVAGYGMLKMREWARLLSIFLAVFTLFAFPVGTVIGAVIIWYLFQGEVKAAFEIAVDREYTTDAVSAEAPPADEKDFQYYPPSHPAEEPPASIPDPTTGEEGAGPEATGEDQTGQ